MVFKVSQIVVKMVPTAVTPVLKLLALVLNIALVGGELYVGAYNTPTYGLTDNSSFAPQAPGISWIRQYNHTLLLCEEKASSIHTTDLQGNIEWSLKLETLQSPVHASAMLGDAVVVSCYGNGSADTAGVAVVRGIGTDSISVTEMVIVEYGHNIHFADVFHPPGGVAPFVVAGCQSDY